MEQYAGLPQKKGGANWIPRAFASVFTARHALAWLLTVVFLLVPFCSPVAFAIAFYSAGKPIRKGDLWLLLKTAVKMAVCMALLFAPSLLFYYLHELLSTRLGVTTPWASIPLLVLAIIFAVDAAIRLPMALCHLAAGGTVKQAMDARFIKRMISASIGRYIASLFLLLPLAFFGSLPDLLPFWVSLPVGALYCAYTLFVAANLFTGGYEKASGRSASTYAAAGMRPAQRVAFMLAFITAFAIIMQPLQASAGPQEDEYYQSQPVLPADFEERYNKAEEYFIRTGDLKPGTKLVYNQDHDMFFVRSTKVGAVDELDQLTINCLDVATDLMPTVSTVKNIIQTGYYYYRSRDTKLSPEQRAYYRRMAWLKAAGAALGPLSRVGKVAATLNGSAVMHIAGRGSELVSMADWTVWGWERVGNVGLFTGGLPKTFSPGEMLQSGLKPKQTPPASAATPEGTQKPGDTDTPAVDLQGKYVGSMFSDKQNANLYGGKLTETLSDVVIQVSENNTLSIGYTVTHLYVYEYAGASIVTTAVTPVAAKNVPLNMKDGYPGETDINVEAVTTTEVEYKGEMYQDKGGKMTTTAPVKVEIHLDFNLDTYNGKANWPVFYGVSVHTITMTDPESQKTYTADLLMHYNEVAKIQ